MTNQTLFPPNSSLDGIDEAVIRHEKAKARELRASRWWKQKISSGLCHYCGGQFRPAELTMDHVVPLSLGGQSVKTNLVPACKACNNLKKGMSWQDWEEHCRERRNRQESAP